MTPPDVPQAALIQNASHAWLVDPHNQLAAIYYTDEDYEKAEKMRTMADVLLGMYLAVTALALVSRKFIGL